ncbi:MAG: 1-(5-phosphoribosyl)-5-[(5-phosphoribosylamino)methylideneamino]imidazole-4-carboxamide isomerase [Lachnospiraceae bacterium]|jgi:phosphoribosylformimino-5-aminoimidazole carboxamide ribotide isomerase|nr:1-(5-phosphoribosyl)-5-[(5-phosphoribosylamino)methylideneamino]imidazole-4-carboxamide isomerase [Lachnospiraceae bacterium]
MKLFPAIDLIDGCVVRLVKGDYAQKTVYSSAPIEVAKAFLNMGADCLHVVDLDGARDGGTPNMKVIEELAGLGLFVEVGGGIRSEDVIRRYIDAGVSRVILGTAAQDLDFVRRVQREHGDRIAVGVDVKEGKVAVKGWTKLTSLDCFSFCEELERAKVGCVICTDVSRDGLLTGPNLALYRTLSERFSFAVMASGGVSSIGDIRALKELGLYGAILGKALYTGAVGLGEALALVNEPKEEHV